jgi:RNA polymerase-binding transcription factor DksA
MAIIRKKPTGPARRAGTPSASRAKSLALQAGKGKPAAKKPAVKPAPKPAAKPVVKPAAKSVVKPAAKAGPAAKPSAKPAPKAPPVLNKGAAAAKAMAEKRAAERAAAEARRAPRLVPATPGAVRPGASKAVPAKGKSAPRPAPEVRPLGVLPPEAMAKSRPSPSHSRVVIPTRTSAAPPAGTPRASGRGDDRLTEADLKHFEQRLLEERARIMREMGHFEDTLLKVNPRDSAGDVGGYSFHMADAGTDSMEREISFDIASKEGRLMREIDDALRRIYNGVYGICEASGQTIPRARLEALPWARYTVKEQENVERQQRAGRLTKEEE